MNVTLTSRALPPLTLGLLALSVSPLLWANPPAPVAQAAQAWDLQAKIGEPVKLDRNMTLYPLFSPTSKRTMLVFFDGTRAYLGPEVFDKDGLKTPDFLARFVQLEEDAEAIARFQRAQTVTFGQEKAPLTLYVADNPLDFVTQLFYQAIRPDIEAGRVKVIAAPIDPAGVLKDTTVPDEARLDGAAELLRAQNPWAVRVALLEHPARNYKTPADLHEKVQANTDTLFTSQGPRGLMIAATHQGKTYVLTNPWIPEVKGLLQRLGLKEAEQRFNEAFAAFERQRRPPTPPSS